MVVLEKKLETAVLIVIDTVFNLSSRVQQFIDRAFPVLDVKEFKELELPSETKAKQPQIDEPRPARPKARKRGKSKQLQLFFTRPIKLAILRSIEFIERIGEENTPSYQNRFRS